MSPRLVSVLGVAALGSSCFLAVWFATREPSSTEEPALPTGQRPLGEAEGARTARPDAPRPQAAVAPMRAAERAGGAEVLVTPLFDASVRLDAQQPTALRFRARHASGEAATGIDLTLAVVQGSREPMALAVRDAGGGLYDAEFVPPGPGEFMALVTVRGQPTRSVRLGVVDAPNEPGEPQGPNGALSVAAGRSGGGHLARRGR